MVECDKEMSNGNNNNNNNNNKKNNNNNNNNNEKFGVNEAEWRELNSLARGYIDVQKTRVGFGLRMDKLEDNHLVDVGLYLKIIEEKKDEKTGKVRRSTKIIANAEEKEALGEEEFDKQVEEARQNMKAHRAYGIILKHYNQLKREEEEMLDECKELFEPLSIWKYCQTVKGMKEVAAMTCCGFINPFKMKTVGQLWSYVGYSPHSGKLVRGEQGRSNPLAKGRFFVICRNVMMARDPYYWEIYKIKKDYYLQRPDLVHDNLRKPAASREESQALLDEIAKIREEIETNNKDLDEGKKVVLYQTAMRKFMKKGFMAKIDSMSKRILTKLIMSHAFELITGNPQTDKHRNPIPLKPEDPDKYKEVHDRYIMRHAMMLEKLKELWLAGDEKRYYEYLNHMDIA